MELIWCRTVHRPPVVHLSVRLSVVSFFTCDQAALRTFLSARPSVRPSVTPFSQCSPHRIIMKFSGVITNDRSDVHAKSQGQRSKVKVTEVKTQFSCFWTVIPVWIMILWWNDAQSLMLLRKGALNCFSRSPVKFQGHTAKKIVDFDSKWAFPDCNSSLNSLMAMKWCTKQKQHRRVALLFFEVKFRGHSGQIKSSILTRIESLTVTPVWIHSWLWNDAQSLR